MNTSKIKSFAPAVRRQLLEAVTRKLDFVLSAQTPDFLATYANQVEALSKLAQLDRTGLIERVAYTWFNRLAALRYLDAKGWHPFRARVLMPTTPEETQPELLKLARTHALPEELRRHTQPDRLNELLDGHVPSANPQGEVYRQLVLAACRFYNALLPDLFERLDDETELLLPDDLLTEHSVAHSFRTEITDADCAEVEILGWLYQFYISEKKDAVMARKSAVPTADIPAVTQLFTPHWIVRYLVENSLGRLWLLNHPESRLREQMPYYIESMKDEGGRMKEEHEEPANVNLSSSSFNLQPSYLQVSSPTEIKLLDPACGSGHMLTYAFDLLYAIYAEAGYPPSEIPGLILANNLYGLDICPRATQLAALALVLKAREKSRPFFQPNKFVQPKIIALQNISFDKEGLERIISSMKDEVRRMNEESIKYEVGSMKEEPDIFNLHTSSFNLSHDLNLFEHATTFGSLLQPKLSTDQIASLRQRIINQEPHTHGDIFAQQTKEKVLLALKQAEMLTQRYHVVVANPPYMGSGGMNESLKNFAKNAFPNAKSDLFAMFMVRNIDLIIQNGYMGTINLPSWLFLSTFESFREYMVNRFVIESLLHMGRGIFGIDWGSTAFIIKKAQESSKKGYFFRLHKRNFQHIYFEDIGKIFLNAKNNHNYKYDFDAYRGEDGIIEIGTESNENGLRIYYESATAQFKKISSSPIAYWAGDKTLEAFGTFKPLGEFADTRLGMATADNERFIRRWHETNFMNINLSATSTENSPSSRCRWFPYAKGGDFRKWYGNYEFLVDWLNDGEAIRNFSDENGKVRSHNYNLDYIFTPGITWNALSSSNPSMRLLDNALFDNAGSSCFPPLEQRLPLLIFLNSKLLKHFIEIISPTLNYQPGDIARVPLNKKFLDSGVASKNGVECVMLARADWDNFETSWDFKDFPLLRKEVASKEATSPQASSDSPSSHCPLKAQTLEQNWLNWFTYCQRNIARMQALETENNRLFIDAYGLQDELTPEVPEEQITLARADRRKDMAALLSYAIGCMMGRYSLDAPGLILADAGATVEDYWRTIEERLKDEQEGMQNAENFNLHTSSFIIHNSSFILDQDGILPILDGEWFEDDIVARTREFLRATFDEVGLRDNIRFIEESLGKDLRKYFLTDFYKDHLQTYKKRPIYWLVQSPKKGFSVLIYLHRYTKDTMNRVLNRYLRPYQEKLRNRLAQLAQLQVSESVSTRDKTAARKEAEKLGKILHECEEWERQTLLPLAQQRIELDLDDGVKVNYLKLGEALAPIPGLAGKDSD